MDLGATGLSATGLGSTGLGSTGLGSTGLGSTGLGSATLSAHANFSGLRKNPARTQSQAQSCADSEASRTGLSSVTHGQSFQTTQKKRTAMLDCFILIKSQVRQLI